MFVPAPLHGFAFWFDVDFNGPVRQKSKKQASQSLDWNKQNASPSSKKKSKMSLLFFPLHQRMPLVTGSR
jgi:hypothetical protein